MNSTCRYQVLVAPSSSVTPAILKAKLMPFEVKVVETCLGVELSGSSEEAKKAIDHLRKNFPKSIFIRPLEPYRGKDPLFRGYLQTDVEYRALSWIVKAFLEEAEVQPAYRSPDQNRKSQEALLFCTADPERTDSLTAVNSRHAFQRLEEPFWLCRDAINREIIAIGGTQTEAVLLARRRGYTFFTYEGEETGEKGHIRFLAGKLARCQYARQNFAKEVDIALTLFNDRLMVRCPLVHTCGPLWWEGRCPYGKLDQGFFSPKSDDVYLKNAPSSVEFFKLIPNRVGTKRIHGVHPSEALP